MKNYTITVNGNVYDVTVEEKGAGAAPQAPRAAAPATAPKAAPAAPKGSGTCGRSRLYPGKGRSCRQSIQTGSKRWTECKEGRRSRNY